MKRAKWLIYLILICLMVVSCVISSPIQNESGNNPSIGGVFSSSNTPEPSRTTTPSPTYEPYYTPTIWQFEPMYSVFDQVFYDAELGAIKYTFSEKVDKLTDDNIDQYMMTHDNPDVWPISVCGWPEFQGDQMVAYVTGRTQSFWGNGQVPEHIPLYGTAVMRADNCRYEVVWVGPAKSSIENITFQEYYYEQGLIFEDGNMYKISPAGKKKIIGRNYEDAVIFSCSSDFNIFEDKIVFLTSSTFGAKDADYRVRWIGQYDCSSIFDNGQTGKIEFVDYSNDVYFGDHMYLDIDYDQWEFAKIAATNVANVSTDNDDFKAFATLFAATPQADSHDFFDLLSGFGGVETNFHAYAFSATMDAEYANIHLDNLNEYVSDFHNLAKICGLNGCWNNTDQLPWITLDWNLVTTTATVDSGNLNQYGPITETPNPFKPTPSITPSP